MACGDSLSIRLLGYSHVLLLASPLFQIIVHCMDKPPFVYPAGLQLDGRVAASSGLLRYDREFICELQCRHELRGLFQREPCFVSPVGHTHPYD